MGSSSSSSNLSTSSSDTHDNKIAADGEATVIRNEGGDLLVTQTSQEAVQLTQILADTLGEGASDLFGLAYNAGDDARALSASALDFARDSAALSKETTTQALDTVGRGFAEALAESREDDTQIATQLITYGLPVVAIFLLWSMSK